MWGRCTDFYTFWTAPSVLTCSNWASIQIITPRIIQGVRQPHRWSPYTHIPEMVLKRLHKHVHTHTHTHGNKNNKVSSVVCVDSVVFSSSSHTQTHVLHRLFSILWGTILKIHSSPVWDYLTPRWTHLSPMLIKTDKSSFPSWSEIKLAQDTEMSFFLFWRTERTQDTNDLIKKGNGNLKAPNHDNQHFPSFGFHFLRWYTPASTISVPLTRFVHLNRFKLISPTSTLVVNVFNLQEPHLNSISMN